MASVCYARWFSRSLRSGDISSVYLTQKWCSSIIIVDLFISFLSVISN